VYTKTSIQDRNQVRYSGAEIMADSLAVANTIPLAERTFSTKVYCILEEEWFIADSQGNWRPYKNAIGYAQGIKGDKGDQGDEGPEGPEGPEGAAGVRGPAGLPGTRGPEGRRGPKGEQGEQGEKGDKGDQGDIGPIGLTGARGERGYPGGTQWTVGPDDPDFNTPPDFYINIVTRGVFGPKEVYLPKKNISPILADPKSYDIGTLSLGMRIKILQDGTITHLKFYKMKDDALTTRKLNIWDDVGNLIAQIQTTNESSAGWQKYELATPIPVLIDEVFVISYGVDGIYGMTNPIGVPMFPSFFEFEGSGWNDADMESFPSIDPTPDTPLYFVDFSYDETPPEVWPLLGYLASTPI